MARKPIVAVTMGDPAGIGPEGLLVATKRENEGCADERQDEEAGKEAEAEHQRAPKTRYQTTRTATPISIPKA